LLDDEDPLNLLLAEDEDLETPPKWYEPTDQTAVESDNYFEEQVAHLVRQE
jgi:hypothetical protein